MHFLQKMWPHFVDVSSINWSMQMPQVKVGESTDLLWGNGGMETSVACHQKLLKLVEKPFKICPFDKQIIKFHLSIKENKVELKLNY